MNRILAFVLTAFLLQQNISIAAEAAHTESSTQTQQEFHSKEPDFSPPKDLKGPVFPPEELIGEPNADTNRFLTEFINMMATLGLIIGLILIVAWFLKRMLNTRQEQANVTSLIKIVERRSLSPKTAIYLLEVEGKSVLIAESQSGVTRLVDFESPKDIEEAKALPSTFNKLLEKNGV